MSVLNDMLRDLESRKGPPSLELERVAPPPPRRQGRRYAAMALSGMILGAAVLAAMDVGEQALVPGTGPPEVVTVTLSPPSPPTVHTAVLERPEPDARLVVATPHLERPRPPADPEPVEGPATAAPPALEADAVAQAEPEEPAPESGAPADDAGDAPDAGSESTDAGTMERRPSSPDPEVAASRAHEDGVEALSAGSERRAEAAFREALAYDPGHAASRRTLAALLVRQGRQGEALALLREGLTRDPEQPRLAFLAGRILLERGETGEALRTLRAAAPPVGADPDYHTLLAAAHQRDGDHETAAGHYQRLLGLEERGRWWLGRAVSLEHLGQHEEAVSAYERALAVGGLGRAAAEYAERALERLAAY